MPLHIALLESRTPTVAAAVALRCAAVDASLHLVGPLGFGADEPAFRTSAEVDWDALDWWLHPGWRDFRDAMTRDRCIYFAADGTRDPGEAPFRSNSVLVFGDEALGLPERIRDKYPERVFRLPPTKGRRAPDLPSAVEATLAFAAQHAGKPPAEGRSAAKGRRSRNRRPR
ncbi:MAG: TrmH family RNA methyltransferase [Gemmatimonadota bacterium]